MSRKTCVLSKHTFPPVVDFLPSFDKVGRDSACAGSPAGNEDVPAHAVERLPCLSRNNSTESGEAATSKSSSDQEILDFNVFSKAHKKSACALAWNVQALAEKFGLENLGFLTLTFADHVLCPKEAQRRFNSLATHVLRTRYLEFVRVIERQKSGRIHYHLVVVLNRDIRTGFDFSAASNGDYKTANLAIRSEWAFWRKTAKLYGFGRTELFPIRSTAEGIARYVGKYISKHVAQRQECDKGVRLVEYTRGARMAATRFSWGTDGARQWRAKVGLFCRIIGAGGATPDRSPVKFSDLSRILGPKWAFHHREFIASLPLFDSGSFVTDTETGEAVRLKFDGKKTRVCFSTRVVHPRNDKWGIRHEALVRHRNERIARHAADREQVRAQTAIWPSDDCNRAKASTEGARAGESPPRS